MLFFKKPAAVNDLDTPSTVIGKGVYIEAARMTGEESVRIDGIYKGNIEINGSLVLGDSGSVTGDIHASYFLVAGEVNGNIACDTQLHFASTSKVAGDVQAASLVVDEGAQVSGRYIVSGARNEPAGLSDNREEQQRLVGGYGSNE
ncbi:MAG: polymer-forming cytoskeletal protein [Defluviitaleaceae bacterium]|nr:polymer-forming cytoskeletal protein [Defluviitaleaceae bacterium]MCL2263436.1 polymer-forming cytoskeletal protein [Defluviitaleaceae bacterium]